MRAVVAFAFVLVAFSVVAAQEYIDPNSFHGLDVIFSNDTSFLDQIDYFHKDGEAGIYVAGYGHILQVNEWPVFNISYYPVFRNWRGLLDFKTFNDADGNSWAVGTVSNQGYGWFNNSNDYPGLNYPLALVGGSEGNSVEIFESPPGFYLLNAVTLDLSATNETLAYFVGWHQHFNATEGVNFTIIRTKVNTKNALANPPIYPVFQYNHTGGDRAYLHGESFIAYSREFKPWIFHSSRHYHLVVVDPATNSIYRVSTPLDTTQPLAYNETTGRFRIGGRFFTGITGATYDANRGHVYIGIAGLGSLPGRLIVVDIFDLVVVKNITLGEFQSNPKALALNAWGPDTNATTLYIGLNGGVGILRVDLATWQVTGIATLSPFLHNVYALALGREHVYFVTNEQHSKVGRVPLNNFCASTCDILFGYCNNTQCQCGPDFLQVDPTNNRCVLKPQPTQPPAVTTGSAASTSGSSTSSGPTPPPAPTQAPTPAPVKPDPEKIIHKEKSGEIALGILFAITFILAAVGWYLVYKARSHGVYASLITNKP